MSLVQQYLSRPHRNFFEKISAREILQSIESMLDQKQIQGHWIYLSHSDPLTFALSFLSILDRGGAPIALSQGKGLELDSWALIENNWYCQKPVRAVDTKDKKYAVPTSGTTGKPKLCEFSLETALQNAKAHGLGFELQDQNEILQTLPVHHSYGIIAYILTPIALGCSVNFCPGMVGLRTMRKKADKVHPRSVLHVSPSQARFILKDAVSIEAVNKISIGGGSISIQELKSLQALLPKTDIYVSYGLTEAGPRVTAGRFSESLLTGLSLQGPEHWIGSAIDQVQLHLADSTDGKVGRLCIDSPYLKKNISDTELNEGRLLTRDRVRLEKGQVFFISREDDLLKYGGVTIYPQDIESVVRKWQGVTDVIILKQEDPVYGDVPILFIEGTLDLDQAQDLVSNEIPFSTAIKEIHILERFPRQSLEKVDRKKLLESVRSQTQ